MGYDLHITRKEFHYDEEGPDISKEEWIEFVNQSPEFKFSEKGVNGDYFAYWSEASNQGCEYDDAWLDWMDGCIYTKNPDEVLIEKMLEISEYFDAKVQGDDGEVYTSPKDYHEEEIEESQQKPKKSWIPKLFGM